MKPVASVEALVQIQAQKSAGLARCRLQKVMPLRRVKAHSSGAAG